MSMTLDSKVDRLDRKLSLLLEDVKEVRTHLENNQDDVTTKKAAAMMGVEYNTFMQKYSNVIPYRRQGRKKLYKPADVVAFKKSIDEESPNSVPTT